MPKFLFQETIHQEKVHTARVGTIAAPLTDNDLGKPVKLVGDSQYDLCADGDVIEGYLNSTNAATQDGFKIGGVIKTGYKSVIVSGAALAIGDFVVAAAQPAKGTKLASFMLVKKAAGAPEQGKFWGRVESLGQTGTGAAGTEVVIDLG